MTYQSHCSLPEEILEQIAVEGMEALPELIRILINEAMRLEREQYLGAGPYERSPERKGHVNGYKSKTLKTCLLVDKQNTIVLSAGEVGILIHEIGHIFEADQPRSKSILNSKIGIENLSITDNPTFVTVPGSMKFDDEGNKCVPTTLVDSGYVVNLLKTNEYMGAVGAPPASARRASYKNFPLPRVTTTYVHNGDNDPEQVITQINRGIFVSEISSCRVDPLTLNCQSIISLGYLIRNGELTESVRLRFNFNSLNLLSAIRTICNDLDIVAGKGECGKRGQYVPVSYGEPTILLKGLDYR
jgi:TldD protein